MLMGKVKVLHILLLLSVRLLPTYPDSHQTVPKLEECLPPIHEILTDTSFE